MKKRVFLFCAATLIMSMCAGQMKHEGSALLSLVEAERSFARASLEIGTRPAFMKFFADDAVVFRPHPVRYKEAMKSVPLPANPLETTLEWEPLYADVALSGDMGYTTGPSVWTDHSPAKRPPYFGYYFSVWKKQLTGEWKVVFDIGTEQPGPHSGSRTFRAAHVVDRSEPLPKASIQEHMTSLMDAEREFLAFAQKEGGLKAVLQYAGTDARVYRQRDAPTVGSDSLRSYFSIKPYLSLWQPMFCDVAHSGDLGYVYGSYEVVVSTTASKEGERGYYLRVWHRDAANEWKFVSEVTSPLPPEQSKSKH